MKTAGAVTALSSNLTKDTAFTQLNFIYKVKAKSTD